MTPKNALRKGTTFPDEPHHMRVTELSSTDSQAHPHRHSPGRNVPDGNRTLDLPFRHLPMARL